MSRYSGTIRALVADIRNSKKQTCLFTKSDLNNPDLTEKQCARLQEHFDLWWNSWIEGKLEQLACKDKKYSPKDK